MESVITKREMDMASSIQKIIEEVLVLMVRLTIVHIICNSFLVTILIIIKHCSSNCTTRISGSRLYPDVNSGDYKLMGLAPYGEPVYYQLIKDKLIDIKSDGSYRLNLEYFDFQYGRTMIPNRPRLSASI